MNFNDLSVCSEWATGHPERDDKVWQSEINKNNIIKQTSCVRCMHNSNVQQYYLLK